MIGVFFPFKNKIESLVGVNLRNQIRIVAHKIVSCDEVDVHNDFCGYESGYENYRFIFQFGQPSQLISGGKLHFLDSKDKKDIIKKYEYIKNFGVCFQINPHSYHYLSPVVGERHTLVMYLWDANCPFDGSGEEVAGHG